MPKNISKESVVAAYKRYAPIYDKLFGSILEPGRIAMAKKINEIKPRVILEIGVGTGLTLPRYPATSTVVGVDVSQDMLCRARIQASKLPDRHIVLQQMDAEALDHADNHFDCVAIPYVLSVTPDPFKLLAEARRVCKVGGSIIIVNHFSGAGAWRIFEILCSYFSARIGFKSKFLFSEHIAPHDWKILSVQNVNLMGLSKIVLIENRS